MRWGGFGGGAAPVDMEAPADTAAPVDMEALAEAVALAERGGGGGPQCFLRGTAILTDCGEKPVEDLRIGDRVALPDGSARPIRWVGRQVFKKSGARWHEGVVPIRVSRHALDSRTPHSDLYLSPGPCAVSERRSDPREGSRERYDHCTGHPGRRHVDRVLCRSARHA